MASNYAQLNGTGGLPKPASSGSNGAPGWQWMTVGEVARSIGLTEERVRQLIRERKIKATKIGGWLVQPDDLTAFIKSRTNVTET